MSITASGVYGLTLEKFFNNGAALSLEAEDNKVALVTDSYTPNFDTHDFYGDLTNEIANGGGYTTGGIALTGTEVTLSSGVLTYDATDSSWASSTIASAMAAVLYADAVTDELILLSDFVNAVSTSNGTLLVAWAATGLMTLDYTP